MENLDFNEESYVKKIRIIHGEEYREKIETDLQKEDFFFESFNEANSILASIIKEQDAEKVYIEKKDYRYTEREYIYKDIEKKNSLVDKIYINNIITFNAGRGQGKTSALHTFAQCLDNFNRYAENDYKKLFDEYVSKKFKILPIIDPTELNGESIIRVFVAQLFKFYQNITENLQVTTETKSKRSEILELFQKCYDNIKYMQGSYTNSEWTSDLESLMKLGNVTEIKENLTELINELFKLDDLSNMRYNHGKPYDKLVVRIDDTDLCMSDAFDICEEIREYLSLNNVVILMALDIRQLKYAIFQKYIKKYKQILSLGDEDYYKKSLIKKCDFMASRYVEKMFPNGYVIDLPIIDEVVKKNYPNIKIDYKIKSNGMYVDASNTGSYQDSKNMHEQILNLLYERTGIIVKRRKDKVHFILPDSMRALNHFLRLLSDMEPININELYDLEESLELDTIKDEDKRDIRKKVKNQKEKLTKNLHDLKMYYLNYCNPNRLGLELSEQFVEIADSDNVYQSLGELIQKWFKDNEREHWEYSDVAAFLYQQKDYNLLCESIEVFLDIIIHETFISMMDNEYETMMFSNQFKEIIAVNTGKGENRQKYKVFNFDTDKEIKNSFFIHDNNYTKFSLDEKLGFEAFCRGFDSEDKEVELFINDGNDYCLNNKVNRINYDILKILNYYFDNQRYDLQNYDIFMNLATVLMLRKAASSIYEKYSDEISVESWDKVILDLVNNIDENINDNLGYLGVKCDLGSRVYNIWNNNILNLKKLFLLNKTNFNRIFDKTCEKIEDILKQSEESGKRIREELDKSDNEIANENDDFFNLIEKFKKLADECIIDLPFIKLALSGANELEDVSKLVDDIKEKIEEEAESFTDENKFVHSANWQDYIDKRLTEIIKKIKK